MSLNKTADSIVVITDTSCLIILEKITLLEVLHQLFSAVLTTPEIAAEYGSPLPEWVTVISVKNESLKQEFSLMVDKGEASAIALAQETPNQFLITDDLEARKLSLKLGLAVIGTLGVLLRAKQAGHIHLVKPYIEQMKQTDFRVSDELYQTVLRKANEAD
jgi:predicted nucleic acid-binding protein